MAIEAQGLEIQIGARTLLHPTDFHVSKGDKIGLVGRNGAGKTTLTRVITGEMLPAGGKVRVTGKLGYLPQDTHADDPSQTALDRMMSARDIAAIISRMRKAEREMTDPDPDVMTKAMNRYDKAMQDFEKAGGYAAQSEATAMAASLGLPLCGDSRYVPSGGSPAAGGPERFLLHHACLSGPGGRWLCLPDWKSLPFLENHFRKWLESLSRYDSMFLTEKAAAARSPAGGCG